MFLFGDVVGIKYYVCFQSLIKIIKCQHCLEITFVSCHNVLWAKTLTQKICSFPLRDNRHVIHDLRVVLIRVVSLNM